MFWVEVMAEVRLFTITRSGENCCSWRMRGDSCVSSCDVRRLKSSARSAPSTFCQPPACRAADVRARVRVRVRAKVRAKVRVRVH